MLCSALLSAVIILARPFGDAADFKDASGEAGARFGSVCVCVNNDQSMIGRRRFFDTCLVHAWRIVEWWKDEMLAWLRIASYLLYL